MSSAGNEVDIILGASVLEVELISARSLLYVDVNSVFVCGIGSAVVTLHSAVEVIFRALGG